MSTKLEIEENFKKIIIKYLQINNLDKNILLIKNYDRS